MLGGCALVNLTLFEGLHTELQYPNEMVERSDWYPRQWRPRCFYDGRYLFWMEQLDLPLEQFKKQFTMFAKYGRGNLQEKLEWLKEWEEDARTEGLYTIQS